MKSRVYSVLFAGSLALAACGPSQADFDARGRQIQQLNGQLQEVTTERDRLRSDDAEMRNRLAALGENVTQLQASNSATQSELEAARQREEELRRRQQQAEARLATFRQMLERFNAMINSGQLRVHVVRGRMVIELPAGILFESGDARLRGPGEEVLRQVATVLRQIPDRDFLVAGHTDNVQIGRGGRFHDNWELSAERAVNVVRFLQTNGVPAEHLSAAGYADSQPANPNDTEEHRTLNRRVEIVLMPNINELPDLSSLDNPTSGGSGSGGSGSNGSGGSGGTSSGSDAGTGSGSGSSGSGSGGSSP